MHCPLGDVVVILNEWFSNAYIKVRYQKLFRLIHSQVNATRPHVWLVYIAIRQQTIHSTIQSIHRSPVNSPHKCQWRGALMFSLNCACTYDWVNKRNARDERCHRAHYDITVMHREIPEGAKEKPVSGRPWIPNIMKNTFFYSISCISLMGLFLNDVLSVYCI